MTIETFFNELLTPVAMADDTAIIGVRKEDTPRFTNDLYELFKCYSDIYVTEAQKNCFEMYYNMKMSQRRISEYLRIKQPTVSEHISKARENYLTLTKILYFAYLEGVNFEREKASV